MNGLGILRPVTALLVFLFLVSAVMNLGFKIPLGFVVLSFSSPSASIAAFEVLIGVVLVVSVALSKLYVYGGGYFLATVGIIEGLLSPGVQGLARNIHETMIPFLLAGWVLLVLSARSARRTKDRQTPTQKGREVIMVLQFFVGALVTLGGVAFAVDGTRPVGTALGALHLVIGLVGLFGGYVFLKRKAWSRKFLVGINSVTIVYSAFAETLAEVYAYLPPGINDALIGTIIAIIVSAVIIYMLRAYREATAQLRESQQLADKPDRTAP
jgi:hypothetical protein